LLLWARRAGDIDRFLQGRRAQQQMRAVSRRQLTQEAEHRSRCGRRYSYTELRGLVRQDGRVTHWRRLPGLNVTALAYREDIQLRADNRFLLSAEQVMLRDTRQTFRFVLTRPVYHSDVSALEFSLAVVYAGQLRRAGIYTPWVKKTRQRDAKVLHVISPNVNRSSRLTLGIVLQM